MAKKKSKPIDTRITPETPLPKDVLLGRVMRRTKGFYYLWDKDHVQYECKVKGSLFRNSKFDNQIAVGDMVRFRFREGEDIGLIESIEDRKSFLSRTRVGIAAEQVIAANLDTLFLVQSAKDPVPRANLVYRMLVAAVRGKIKPVLVMTKADLATSFEIEAFIKPFQSLDLDIFITSQQGGERDAELKELLQSSVSVLSGPSGVGKSSLLNRLIKGLNLKVGEISERTSKGAHTTTYATMHHIGENGFVIDTPGIREFSLWKVTQNNLYEYFPLVETYQNHCHHKDCRHVTEPKCALKDAVRAGDFSMDIYEAYLQLYEAILNPF